MSVFYGVRVKLDETKLADFRKAIEPLTERAFWTAEHKIHATIYYVARAENVPPNAVATLRQTLHAAADGLKPFTIKFHAAQAVMTGRDPRILTTWLAVADEGRELAALRERLMQQTLQLALPGGDMRRTFRPHVTVGRIRPAVEPGRLAAALAPFDGSYWGPCTIDAVYLFKTVQDRMGSRYAVLDSQPLV